MRDLIDWLKGLQSSDLIGLYGAVLSTILASAQGIARLIEHIRATRTARGIVRVEVIQREECDWSTNKVTGKEEAWPILHFTVINRGRDPIKISRLGLELRPRWGKPKRWTLPGEVWDEEAPEPETAPWIVQPQTRMTINVTPKERSKQWDTMNRRLRGWIELAVGDVVYSGGVESERRVQKPKPHALPASGLPTAVSAPAAAEVPRDVK